MTSDDEHDLEEPQLGEKGPPAWKERDRGDGEPMSDEPPDSSSEVAQVAGLFYDEDDGDEDDGDEDETD